MTDQPDRFDDAFIDDLRKRVSIADVASRHVSWDQRKTLASKGDYWACCPFHDEKSPSFHVREDKGKYKCFGCGAGGDVIDLLMHLERRSFPDAVKQLAECVGKDVPQERRFAERRDVEAVADHDKRAAARSVWDASKPIAGSLAEIYLRTARGIAHDLSEADLRFHPMPPEGYRLVAGRWPGMVAAIRTPNGDLIGAHVTYLKPDGSGKRPDEPGKPDRRVLGQKDGGFIRLASFTDRVVVGEGIESAFSAAEISGRPPLSAVTSENMAKLPILDGVKDWLIAYDRDHGIDPNTGKPRRQGYKAGKALAVRLFAAERTARAFPPPNDVKDWNDVAQRRRS